MSSSDASEWQVSATLTAAIIRSLNRAMSPEEAVRIMQEVHYARFPDSSPEGKADYTKRREARRKRVYIGEPE